MVARFLLTTIFGLLASVAIGAEVTYVRVNGEVKAVPAAVESVAETTLVTVPRGMHAHTRTDGTTFIHGDENRGSAPAHEGVAWPWDKTATAGQTVEIQTKGPVAKTAQTVRWVTRTICENGVCRLVTVPVVTPAGDAETAPPPSPPGVVASAVKTVATATTFAPLLPRVAQFREWFAERPKLFNGPIASGVRFRLGR